jgi:hypothetical protein
MQMTIAGIESGEKKYGYRASDATERIGTNMIDTMSKSLSGMSKVLGSDLIDFDPTITPVLDLSLVRKDAAGLAALFEIPTLDVSTSYNKAQAAKATVDESRQPDEADGDSGSTTYNFTQNNTSPKALSKAEIYRQTENLISRARNKVGENA